MALQRGDLSRPKPRSHIRSNLLWTAVAAAAFTLAACGGESSDGGNDGSSVSGASPTSSQPGPAATQTPPVAATPVPVPLASFEFSDDIIEMALTEAAAAPLEGLPGRDLRATELLNQELLATGVNLSGIEMVIYPAGPAPSFLLVTTSDSTPLIALDGEGDTAGSESLLTQLLASAGVAESGVQNLVLQHSGSDETGPFVFTAIVSLTDLRSALVDGADITDSLTVQVERP